MSKPTIRELLNKARTGYPAESFDAACLLAERVEAVLKLHADDGTGWCYACEHHFPCDTVRALDGEPIRALEGEP